MEKTKAEYELYIQPDQGKAEREVKLGIDVEIELYNILVRENSDTIYNYIIENWTPKAIPLEAEVKPACETNCKKCSCFEMHQEDRLKNFCSMWCVYLTDLTNWNIDKDYCSQFVSKSV